MFKVNNKDTRMTPLAETVNCIITIETVMCIMYCRKYHLYNS